MDYYITYNYRAGGRIKYADLVAQGEPDPRDTPNGFRDLLARISLNTGRAEVTLISFTPLNTAVADDKQLIEDLAHERDTLTHNNQQLKDMLDRVLKTLLDGKDDYESRRLAIQIKGLLGYFPEADDIPPAAAPE